jgi:hypothetical protein
VANAGDLATRETVSELVLQPQSVLILGNNVGMTITIKTWKCGSIANEKAYQGRDPLHFCDSCVPAEVSQVVEVRN